MQSKIITMKFCHIETVNGSQVLFHIFDESIYQVDECSIVVTTYYEGRMKDKSIFVGSKTDAFAKFQSLDFQKEAYNFITECASKR